MTTPYRRRWMREFMSNYRRNPEKREELRESHRGDSFIWRLSKLLSPRYDILMCIQHGPFLAFDEDEGVGGDTYEYSHDKWYGDGTVIEHDNENVGHKDNSNDLPDTFLFGIFPMFWIFNAVCKPGGGDVFKVFTYDKLYSYNTPIKVIFGMVGVLDKYALLSHLNKLTRSEMMTWEDIIEKLINEMERKEWYEINLSDDIDADFHWKLVRWAPQDHPDWCSVQFHTFLRMWERGRRGIGKRIVVECPERNGNVKVRFIASPIFDAMQPVVMEARDRGSRL